MQESIRCDGVHIGQGAQMRHAFLDHGTAVPPGARIASIKNIFSRLLEADAAGAEASKTAKETPDTSRRWPEQIHAHMQVKLARQGMPPDRETLEDVCIAVAGPHPRP